MPLLYIVSAQPSFQYCLGPPRVQSCVNGKALSCYAFRHENRLGPMWRLFLFPEKLNCRIGNSEKSCGSLRIKAVATFEPKCLVQPKDELNGHAIVLPFADSTPPTVNVGSSEDLDEPDEREKLRRMRISEANKGNTPWNKGRKHSPETIQKIRERTKLAMQTPKVKSKLTSLGHSQSKETRKKIGVGVRMGWQRRREKLKLQQTCLYDWQNLIAESVRAGLVGEEELQWDSYKVLNQQLQKEWLESIERRKVTKPKGSKRAPKSIEQRRKIAEAIAAKWADPEYRERVCTGLAKYYGIPEGRERKERKRPPGEPGSFRPPRKKDTELESSSTNETKLRSQRPKLRRGNAPVYKDPFASTKLEMLKNIRAERAASEVKKHVEALQRARLLIAEAEKAAKALEPAATKSPVAQASLMETRKLIAEAIQSIESIEKSQVFTPEDNIDSSMVLTEQQQKIDVEKQMDNDSGYSGSYQKQNKPVNGTHIVGTSENHSSDSGLHTQPIRMLSHGLNNCSSSNDAQLSTSINGRYKYSEFPKAARLDMNHLMKKADHEEELLRKSSIEHSGVHPSVEFGSSLQTSTSHGVPAPNGSVVRKRNSNAVSTSNGTTVHSSVIVQMSSTSEKETHTKCATKKWVRGRLVDVVEER